MASHRVKSDFYATFTEKDLDFQNVGDFRIAGKGVWAHF